MYQQINRKLLEATNKPLYYAWYINDTFIKFSSKSEGRRFFFFFIQSINYILHWNLLVNLKTTATFLFLLL